MRSPSRRRPWLVHCVYVCALLAVCSSANAARFGVQLQPEGNIGADLREKQESGRVRIAQQYGLGYLPLMIMRQLALIEKHASAAQLGNVQVQWTLYPSGEAMNEALKLGFLDFASGGVVPLLRLWDETQNSAGVKGVAALASMPLYLNTRRLKVRSLSDLNDTDRIALPAVNTSIQAVVLRMASAQAFGDEHYARLDKLTVSMPHPQARDALLSGGSDISAHLASPPYQNEELADRRVHRIFNSYDILGGTTSFTALWARSQFRELNPRTYSVVFEALQEAIDILNANKREAAKIFLLQANSPHPVEFIERILKQPEIEYTLTPRGIVTYARFMYQTRGIGHVPAKWQEVFFAEVHGEDGS
jgi:NitT/TauT family transport system substrate-binding protein